MDKCYKLILSDALEAYYDAEKTIIRLKIAVVGLSIILLILLIMIIMLI